MKNLYAEALKNGQASGIVEYEDTRAELQLLVIDEETTLSRLKLLNGAEIVVPLSTLHIARLVGMAIEEICTYNYIFDPNKYSWS